MVADFVLCSAKTTESSQKHLRTDVGWSGTPAVSKPHSRAPHSATRVQSNGCQLGMLMVTSTSGLIFSAPSIAEKGLIPNFRWSRTTLAFQC